MNKNSVHGMLVSLTLIVERVFSAGTRSFNPHGIGEISR